MVGAIIYQSFHEGLLEIIGGLKRWLSFYIFPLIGFGGTHIGVIGDKTIEHGYKINYKLFNDLEEALDEWGDARICFLVGKDSGKLKAKSLSEYDHHENIIYVIGKDYGDIELDKIGKYSDRCDFVHIDTKNDFSSLWSHTVLGIVLWDRFEKLNNGGN